MALGAALGSVLGVETGAAVGKGLFTAVHPLSAVWLRFSFAAMVLLALRALGFVGRHLSHRRSVPRVGHREPEPLDHRPPHGEHRWLPTRSAWLWGLGYAVSLTGMNVSFYLAIARLPLGITVTLEYLGPLAVAIIGSRRRLDLVWAGLAGLGVALLGFRPMPLDPLGVVLALTAATCWAGYISLGSRARRYWTGADLVTGACLLGTVVLVVPAIVLGGTDLWTPHVLGTGLLVGVLSSVLPYRLDMVALGTLSAALFGILQSLAPAAAAVAGWLLLGELLGVGDWVALLAVVIASVGATWTSRGAAPTVGLANRPTAG